MYNSLLAVAGKGTMQGDAFEKATHKLAYGRVTKNLVPITSRWASTAGVGRERAKIEMLHLRLLSVIGLRLLFEPERAAEVNAA